MMKKVNLKILLAFSLVVTCLCGAVMAVTTVNSTAYAMNSNLKTMLEEIDEKIKDKEDLSFSSDPYDYIEGNENYNNILKLGIDALPLLTEELEESDEAGLKEYILSYAIQDISDVNIADLEGEWANSEEFIEKYDTFLRNVEDNINVIVSSDNATKAEKIERLERYGIYAVPYLKEVDSKIDKDKVVQKSIGEIDKAFVKNTEAKNLSKADLDTIENLVDTKQDDK